MIFKKLSIVFFCSLLAIFSLCTLFNFLTSREENNAANPAAPAQRRPVSYLSSVERNLSDHFAFQRPLFSLGSVLKISSGLHEVNNVYIAGDRLLKNSPMNKVSTVQSNINSINQFANKMRSSSPRLYAMIIPTAAGLYADSIPDYADKNDEKGMIEQIHKQLSPDIEMLDAYTPLSSSASESIFYKSDTHWTSLGAYRTYYAMGSSLNYIPLEEGQFNIEHVYHSFLGNLYTKVLYPYTEKDIINLYTSYDRKIEKVEFFYGDRTETFSDIFFRSYLDYDNEYKYKIFLGEPAPVVTIHTEHPSNASIALFKDSFSNTLVQFLAENYTTITLIDLNMITESYEYYIDDLHTYSQILLVYNLDTFWHNANIQKISN